MALICFLIVLVATTAGALTGMGGGVIIKPAMDMLGQYDAATIGILSSLTVLTMSIVSIGKHIRQRTKINLRIALALAIGSVAGGWIGDALLGCVIAAASNTTVVMLQNILLGLLLLGVFAYMQCKSKVPSLHAKRTVAGLLTGIVAGAISTFLGIGGGPINVAVLLFVFSMDTKSAAVNSIITIFFRRCLNYSLSLPEAALPPMTLRCCRPCWWRQSLAGGWEQSSTSRCLKQRLNWSSIWFRAW